MILQVQNLSLHYGQTPVLQNISFTLQQGQHYAISGESGSGKTTLLKALAAQMPYEGTIHKQYDEEGKMPRITWLVENWYRFTNLEGDRNFYYQQRYNRQQRRDIITVQGELEKFGTKQGLRSERLDTLLTAFQYKAVLAEQLIELSSGEHKKLQLIKALWLQPQLLLIDQPYTGLDKASRATLNAALDAYAQNGGTLIITGNDEVLPHCITHQVHLLNGTWEKGKAPEPAPIALPPLPEFLQQAPKYTVPQLIRMKKVSVHYDDKYVLKNIHWEVNAGERWLLQGHNGSGKSTLLSLITADHPQAYAHDIQLFGVQRGGGESIWDIKKRIGLISPELHWYFDEKATVWQSLASGFFDANGLYQQLRYAQKQQVEELLHFLNLQDVKDKLLVTLPLGKQRLALLGRTLIKNPHLLVLDEPCQGLDQQQTQYFNNLVDAISKNGVTLIYVGHFETQLPSCLTHKLVLENGGSGGLIVCMMAQHTLIHQR